MGAQVLQHIVDGIFKARAGLVGSFDPFGDQLADFKAVHSLRQRAVYLVGTHDFTPVNGYLLRAVRSSSEAVGRRQPSRLFSFKIRSDDSLYIHCTPESVAAPTGMATHPSP